MTENMTQKKPPQAGYAKMNLNNYADINLCNIVISI